MHESYNNDGLVQITTLATNITTQKTSRSIRCHANRQCVNLWVIARRGTTHDRCGCQSCRFVLSGFQALDLCCVQSSKSKAKSKKRLREDEEDDVIDFD